MKTVLCIEDDHATAHEIIRRLNAADFTVRWVDDGAQGLALALAQPFDLITLDRKLPSMDGLLVLRALRSQGNQTPVLMISGMDSVDERLEGLRAGGSDYLVKPFLAEELVARVKVVLGRYGDHIATQTIMWFGDLKLDLLTHELSCKQCQVTLRPTEYRLMAFLLSNAGEVVSRAMIFETVWGYHFDPGTKLIDVQLTRLRKVLEDLQSQVSIETLRGAGFRLCLQERSDAT